MFCPLNRDNDSQDTQEHIFQCVKLTQSIDNSQQHMQSNHVWKYPAAKDATLHYLQRQQIFDS